MDPTQERVTQVLPGGGWRWCEVFVHDDGTVEEELHTVVGFAVIEELEPGRYDLPRVMPIFRYTEGGDITIETCFADEWECENGIMFLIDPLWSDGRIRAAVTGAVRTIHAMKAQKARKAEAARNGG